MNFKLQIINLVLFVLLISCGKDSNSNFESSQQGKSGSTARMIIVQDNMYVIDNENLKTFDISTPSNPIETDSINVGFGIETIFPFANYLFIGSTEGMYIYDISNPNKPEKAAEEMVNHFTACDPVVANGNYAYVTLNSLIASCGRTTKINELQIVNIQNIRYPYVENIISMQGPKGLGLDGNNLFICEKELGVIVFDISNSIQPEPIDTLSGFTANDLIPNNGNLMVVCTDGLRQFNYTDINNITLTSKMNLDD